MHESTAVPATTPREFPYPDFALAPPEVRDTFEALPAKINLFRMLAHSHGTYPALMQFTQAVFKQLELSKRHYELIVLFTGHKTRAEYEWRQHLGTAPKAGVRPDQIAAIESDDFYDPSIFDEHERCLLRMADELMRDGAVATHTLKKARRHFTPGQIIEIGIVVGFYRMLAGVIRTVDLDYNPEAAKALAAGM